MLMGWLTPQSMQISWILSDWCVRALKYEQAPKAGHEISLQSPAGLLNLYSSQDKKKIYLLQRLSSSAMMCIAQASYWKFINAPGTGHAVGNKLFLIRLRLS